MADKWTYLVQARGVVRVAVNLRNERRHQFQLCVVCTDVDVKVGHVVLRALPPALGMVGNVVRRADNGRLSVL